MGLGSRLASTLRRHVPTWQWINRDVFKKRDDPETVDIIGPDLRENDSTSYMPRDMGWHDRSMRNSSLSVWRMTLK